MAEKVNETYEQNEEMVNAHKVLHGLKNEVKKVIVGQDKMIDLIIVGLLSGGHLLIEGNPGVAKTLTARTVAKALGLNFQRIQFTPDLMPSDVLGTSVFNFKNSEFEFRAGPIFSNIILIDEINRSPAKTQAALFEVMEERQITIDGKTYPMELPFMILATQNPIEMEGTYRLPEAQMDRFLFKVMVDYPQLDTEINIVKAHQSGSINKDLDMIHSVINVEEIMNFQNLLKEVTFEDRLFKYIAEIVRKTRKHPDIFIGASPRASIGIMKAASAMALMRGRHFVIPDDIVAVSEPVLCHRITVTPEREMEGSSATDIIEALVKSIEVPR